MRPATRQRRFIVFAGSDGYEIGPVTLAKDKAGKLYGTTQGGGANCCGTVFRLSPGGSPYAGVIHDGAGNLYNTTPYGGDANCDYGQGCGTVFKVAADGSETTLYAFTGTGVNANPMAGLVMPQAIYGTTYGLSPGAVFRLAPDGMESCSIPHRGNRWR